MHYFYHSFLFHHRSGNDVLRRIRPADPAAAGGPAHDVAVGRVGQARPQPRRQPRPQDDEGADADDGDHDQEDDDSGHGAAAALLRRVLPVVRRDRQAATVGVVGLWLPLRGLLRRLFLLLLLLLGGGQFVIALGETRLKKKRTRTNVNRGREIDSSIHITHVIGVASC